MAEFDEMQALLREKADISARLSLIPYEGTPEIKDIKGRKYLYTRKRVGSRVTSSYVGVYSGQLPTRQGEWACNSPVVQMSDDSYLPLT